MRIQHNIPAMNSYRNYSSNVSKVAKNLEKLSTGYKINRAGDDAAGLAISEKMRIQITGLEKAQDNAKAGINLVQTAEGALTEVHDMLNRMYDLAEQSANGTFDDTTDRKQLQKEINSLREEIDRIADSTNYNGIKLLDGSMESKSVATGGKDLAEVLTIKKDGQLGQTPQAGVYQFDFSNLNITSNDDVSLKCKIFGLEVDPGTIKGGDTSSAESIASKIAEAWNSKYSTEPLSGTTIRAEADNGKITFTMANAPTKKWSAPATIDFAPNAGIENLDTLNNSQANQVSATTIKEAVDSSKGRQYAKAELALNEDMVADGRTLTIGKETYVFAVGRNSAYKDAANVIDLTDMTEAEAASTDGRKKAAWRLTTAAKDNEYFKVGADTQQAVITLEERDGAIDYSVYDLEGSANDGTDEKADKDGKWAGLIKTGFYDSRNSTTGLTLQIGDTAEKFNQMTVSVKDMHCEAMGLSKIDISYQGGGDAAMAAIKAATNYVSDVRGGLGALQNRLDHTINNLSVAQENIQDAESNIRDVDVAKEMMNYTKNNILVQSAQAMLAQANQLPQGVLQLLG